MRAKVIPVFFSLVLMLVSGATPAQTKGKGGGGNPSVPDTKPPSFPNLFQNPTRNNGYEEWVLAADLIQNNSDLDTAIQAEATLTAKRHILADPAVTQALSLLREGLLKPVVSPREDFNETVLLPELTPFRNLGRLLCTAQYVHFADGRVGAAIDDLRVGLAFGYRIQTDSLLSGMVGLAVDSAVLEEFARHLDQLSDAQCSQTLRIVQEFLNAESPAIHLLSLEKKYAFKMLETRRADPNALRSLLKIFDLNKHPEDSGNVQSVQNLLTGHPQDLNTVLDAAQAHINAVYDQALLNLSLPPAQRTPFVKDKADTPDASLCRLIATDPDRVLERYSGDQAKLRLLGLHLLIHRYRWEHNTLPNALTDLHAEDLASDPFTGDSIRYTRQADRYTLSSQGPFKRDDAGQKLSDVRVPVQLIP